MKRGDDVNYGVGDDANYCVGDYVFYKPLPNAIYPAIIESVEHGRYNIRIFFKERKRMMVEKNAVGGHLLSAFNCL